MWLTSAWVSSCKRSSIPTTMYLVEVHPLRIPLLGNMGRQSKNRGVRLPDGRSAIQERMSDQALAQSMRRAGADEAQVADVFGNFMNPNYDEYGELTYDSADEEEDFVKEDHYHRDLDDGEDGADDINQFWRKREADTAEWIRWKDQMKLSRKSRRAKNKQERDKFGEFLTLHGVKFHDMRALQDLYGAYISLISTGLLKAYVKINPRNPSIEKAIQFLSKSYRNRIVYVSRYFYEFSTRGLSKPKQHTVPSQINGNNGSATNTDDVSCEWLNQLAKVLVIILLNPTSLICYCVILHCILYVIMKALRLENYYIHLLGLSLIALYPVFELYYEVMKLKEIDMFKCPSQLNGNQGSWTNSDDVSCAQASRAYREREKQRKKRGRNPQSKVAHGPPDESDAVMPQSSEWERDNREIYFRQTDLLFIRYIFDWIAVFSTTLANILSYALKEVYVRDIPGFDKVEWKDEDDSTRVLEYYSFTHKQTRECYPHALELLRRKLIANDANSYLVKNAMYYLVNEKGVPEDTDMDVLHDTCLVFYHESLIRYYRGSLGAACKIQAIKSLNGSVHA